MAFPMMHCVGRWKWVGGCAALFRIRSVLSNSEGNGSFRCDTLSSAWAANTRSRRGVVRRHPVDCYRIAQRIRLAESTSKRGGRQMLIVHDSTNNDEANRLTVNRHWWQPIREDSSAGSNIFRRRRIASSGNAGSVQARSFHLNTRRSLVERVIRF